MTERDRELRHQARMAEISLLNGRPKVVDEVPSSVLSLLRSSHEPYVDTFGDDQLWPRDAANRYRIYAVRGDGKGRELEVLGTTPSAGGIGQALVQLHEDQKQAGSRLADLGRIGVLDVMPGGRPSVTGEWIVFPFDRSFR